MTKRLLRLAMLAAIASAVATAIKATKRPAATADADTSPSADAWPEVPRNPASS